jgi:hypothetical protein
MSVIGAWVFVDVIKTASFKDPQQAGFFMAVDPYSPKCYNTHKRERRTADFAKTLHYSGAFAKPVDQYCITCYTRD